MFIQLFRDLCEESDLTTELTDEILSSGKGEREGNVMFPPVVVNDVTRPLVSPCADCHSF